MLNVPKSNIFFSIFGSLLRQDNTWQDGSWQDDLWQDDLWQDDSSPDAQGQAPLAVEDGFGTADREEALNKRVFRGNRSRAKSYQ